MSVIDELVGILGFELIGEQNLQKFKSGMKNAGKGAKKAGEQVTALERGVSVLGKAAKFTAGAMVTFAAAAAIAFKKSVSSAIAFEDSFADVKKVLSGSPEQLGKIRKELLLMSTAINQNVNELTDIAASAAQGGIAIQDVTKFTRLVAKASVALGISAERLGKIFPELKNVYKLTVPELEKLGDTANHLSNNFAATADNILDFTNRAASIRTSLNLSIPDIQAFGTGLVASGVKAQVASRAMNGFANRVRGTTKPVKEAFKILGQSQEAFLKDLDTRGAEAILDLFDRISKLDATKQTRVLQGMFGQDFADDLSKAVSNVDLFRRALKTANDEQAKANSLTKEFEARNATVTSILGKMKNAFKAVGIVIGSSFLKPIGEAGNAVTKFLAEIVKADTPIKGLSNALKSIGFNISVEDMTNAQKAFTDFIAPIKELAKIGAEISLDFLKSFISSLDPSTLKSMGGALKDLWAALKSFSQLEGVSEAFRTLGVTLGLIANLAGTATVTAVKLIATTIKTLADALTAFGQGDISGGFKILSDGMNSIANITFEGTVKALSQVLDALSKLTGIDLKKTFTEAWNAFDKFWSDVVTKTGNLGTTLTEVFKEGFADATLAIIDFFVMQINKAIDVYNASLGKLFGKADKIQNKLTRDDILGKFPTPSETSTKPVEDKNNKLPVFGHGKLISEGTGRFETKNGLPIPKPDLAADQDGKGAGEFRPSLAPTTRVELDITKLKSELTSFMKSVRVPDGTAKVIPGAVAAGKSAHVISEAGKKVEQTTVHNNDNRVNAPQTITLTVTQHIANGTSAPGALKSAVASAAKSLTPVTGNRGNVTTRGTAVNSTPSVSP